MNMDFFFKEVKRIQRYIEEKKKIGHRNSKM